MEQNYYHPQLKKKENPSHSKLWCNLEQTLILPSIQNVSPSSLFGLCVCLFFCVNEAERDWQVSGYPGPLRQLWRHHCRALALIEGWLDNIRGESGRGVTAVAANYYYPQSSIQREALSRVGSYTCGLLLGSQEVWITWESARIRNIKWFSTWLLFKNNMESEDITVLH